MNGHEEMGRPARGETHAVVLGAGMAGMFAAAALARQFDAVTVLDRDSLPATPVSRKGVPQGRHTHVLWSGGARAIERLLPGFQRSVVEAGARRIGLPDEMLMYGAYGWLRRFPEQQFIISASQPLLEFTVRQQLSAFRRVIVVDDVEAVGLRGDATRVTGVRVEVRSRPGEEELDADLVVDATGRGSRTSSWLAELGLPPVREDRVDAGWVYATRCFRARWDEFPIVVASPDATPGVPARAGLLLPIEDNRWLVTLSGTRGMELPDGDDAFLDCARKLRNPMISELISRAEPLGEVLGSRSTVNQMRHYGRASRWPEGFVVLGDAAAAFNPFYGQGMGIAAMSAEAVADVLRGRGRRRCRAHRAQKAVDRLVRGAWSVAVGRDAFYPDVVGGEPSVRDRVLYRYLQRVIRAATGDRAANAALLGASSLSDGPARLMAPRVVAAALRAPAVSSISTPPFTPRELALISSDHDGEQAGILS